MTNLIFRSKELKDLRVKLLYVKLENEVILNELTEQLDELLKYRHKRVSPKDKLKSLRKSHRLIRDIKEKEKIIANINMELKNIRILFELNNCTIID